MYLRHVQLKILVVLVCCSDHAANPSTVYSAIQLKILIVVVCCSDHCKPLVGLLYIMSTSFPTTPPFPPDFILW